MRESRSWTRVAGRATTLILNETSLNDMKVRRFELHHVRVPLRGKIKHASRERRSSDSLIARCVLEDGKDGYGEAVPREYVTGETIDSCFEQLRQSSLLAQPPACNSFAEAITSIEAVRLADAPLGTRDCFGNAARCAIELAALDAFGKYFADSFSSVIRIIAPELFIESDRARYGGVITSAKGWKAHFAAVKMRMLGFRDIKVKVAIEGADDLLRLKAIRRYLPAPAFDIRVDANESWSRNDVISRIERILPTGVSSVEQPVRQEDVAALSDVRRQLGVAIMLDESLCSLQDARRAVEQGTADLFSLKLSKCGGLIPSLRIASFAKANSIGCQLSCQVGETGILSAAGRHFACNVHSLRHVEGSYDRFILRENVTGRGIDFGYGGWGQRIGGHGLGIRLDERATRRMTRRTEVIAV